MYSCYTLNVDYVRSSPCLLSAPDPPRACVYRVHAFLLLIPESNLLLNPRLQLSQIT